MSRTLQMRAPQLGPGLLALARREILDLAIARQRKQADRIAIAELRLRWVLERAQEVYAAALAGVDAAAYRRVRESAAEHLLAIDRTPLTAETLARAFWAARSLEEPTFVDGRDLQFVGLDLCDLALANITWRSAKLTLVDAHRADLRGAHVCRAQLRSCTFQGAHLQASRLDRAIVVDSDFGDADCTGSSWRDTRVKGCVFEWARFTNAVVQGAQFHGCSFVAASFLRSIAWSSEQLAGTRFIDCDLRRTDWTGQDLSGVTFIGCKMSGMSGDVRGLDAAVIEKPILTTADYLEEVGGKAEVLRSWSANGHRQIPERAS